MIHDNDETTAEFLIRHMSLADVLAFVNARDEVRRIPTFTPSELTEVCSAQTVPASGSRATTQTLPARGCVLAVENDPFPVKAAA